MVKFNNIFSDRRSLPIEPFLPEGRRVYCIGDIHGRYDLLLEIQNIIKKDTDSFVGNKELIYLGDYIDRGEYSREVIDHLIERPLSGFNTVYLRGNHEQSLLNFLEEAEVGRGWFNYGGLATLISYKVKISKIPSRKEDFEEIQENLKNTLPKEHINFFKNTDISFTLGNYYFVHAGIKPGVPLDEQRPEDQLWIRDKFVRYKKPHQKIIIHGHTITDLPDIQENRIGLDTGAYMSGKLTCLVLEADSQRIIQTSA